VVVAVPVADLGAGAGHAALDHLAAVGRAGAKARFQFLDAWRQEEYAHDVGLHPLVKLLGPLPVDVEQDVLPFLEARLDLRLGRSVMVPEDFSPLEELAVVDHADERRLVDEAVIVAVDFARPYRPRGDRDR